MKIKNMTEGKDVNIKIIEDALTQEQLHIVMEIQATYHFMKPIAQLVAKVNNYDMEKVALFLSDNVKPYPYIGIPDIEKAAKIICEHIHKKSKIRVIGDYDVDGITGASIILTALRALDVDISYYIPNRKRDGYGISPTIVERCKEDGIDLIITVDNGISAIDAVNKANELGIPIIITDHHVPPKVLPTAQALVNPTLESSTYINKDLAGVGVAYKLLQAIMCELKVKPPKPIIDKMYALVAMGTICDVMSLVGENRDLVKKGLHAINEYNAFPQLKHISKQATVGTVGFQIGPRLNACGRLETADIAVEFLTGDSMSQVDKLNDLNKERQRIEKEAYEKIVKRLEGNNKKIIIEVVEDLEEGVTGLIANDLKEHFYRPTIIFTRDFNGKYKSSGRSIDEFDLFTHVQKHLHLLDGGGGHSMACGLKSSTIKQIDDFREAMEKEVEHYEFPTPEEVKANHKVDFSLDMKHTSLSQLQNQLARLAPFGKGNPAPSILFENVDISLTTRIAKGYIITDIYVIDGDNVKRKYTIWGDDTMPESYTGKATFIMTPKNDFIVIKAIQLLDEVTELPPINKF